MFTVNKNKTKQFEKNMKIDMRQGHFNATQTKNYKA